MSTLVLGTPPPELQGLLERRHRAGVDRLDEVWEGVHHMVPGPSLEHARISTQLAELLGPLARSAGLLLAMSEFNLGESEDDFRVPDGGLHRLGAAGIWHATAAAVVEILSPDDESRQKLPFYAEHDVDEVLLVDPAKRTITWLALSDGEYAPIERNGLIDLGPTGLAGQLDWPLRPAPPMSPEVMRTADEPRAFLGDAPATTIALPTGKGRDHGLPRHPPGARRSPRREEHRGQVNHGLLGPRRSAGPQ
jgi:hypothetical protein